MWHLSRTLRQWPLWSLPQLSKQNSVNTQDLSPSHKHFIPSVIWGVYYYKTDSMVYSYNRRQHIRVLITTVWSSNKKKQSLDEIWPPFMEIFKTVLIVFWSGVNSWHRMIQVNWQPINIMLYNITFSMSIFSDTARAHRCTEESVVLSQSCTNQQRYVNKYLTPQLV